MAMIKINDANFYYELHSTGHPIILISGFTGDHHSWLPILNDLSKHFQVLVFDNRGVGQTTDGSRALSVELMAEDVIALARELNLKQPHIVGHSMGGTIAQRIAVHYQEKLARSLS